MRPNAKHGLWQAFIAPVVINLAMFLAPLSAPAAADPSVARVDQAAAVGDDAAPELLRANNGFDLTRPQTAFELRGLDEASSNDTSKTNRAQMAVRLESTIPLGVDWRLGAHAQAPFVQKATTTFETGSADREFGLGDASFQAVVAHTINDRWAAAVGTRVVAQTAAGSLGGGEWQVQPGLGVRYMLSELGEDSYFVPSLRYAMSIPGSEKSRRISEPQIAPTLNINLPGPFFITFYPSNDIRINYGAPLAGQTGRLFLPFDALIGVRLNDQVALSLEGSVPIVKAYPVYNFKTELKLRILF